MRTHNFLPPAKAGLGLFLFCVPSTKVLGYFQIIRCADGTSLLSRPPSRLGYCRRPTKREIVESRPTRNENVRIRFLASAGPKATHEVLEFTDGFLSDLK